MERMKFFVVVFTKKKCEKFQIKKIMGISTHYTSKKKKIRSKSTQIQI
jgi:hypothetical protein